jgi:hypothetical protein
MRPQEPERPPSRQVEIYRYASHVQRGPALPVTMEAEDVPGVVLTAFENPAAKGDSAS